MSVSRSSWHRHPGVRTGTELSIGERLADRVVHFMGSWGFVFWQTLIVALWVTLNVVGWCHHWDAYPFILLNLAFSTQAAYAAPLILIASIRSDARTSEEAHYARENTECIIALLKSLDEK